MQHVDRREVVFEVSHAIVSFDSENSVKTSFDHSDFQVIVVLEIKSVLSSKVELKIKGT